MHPAPNGAVSSTSITSIEATLSEPPSSADLATSYGTYRREVTSDPTHLVLESESTLRLGVVEAAEYSKFTQFVSDVEAAERAILRLK